MPPTSLIDLPGAYRTFVTDAGASAAFAATLQVIKAAAADGNAVLYHCSADKVTDADADVSELKTGLLTR